MEVYRGWYRKSLSRKGVVWHRVFHIDSLLTDQRIAYTVCGRRLDAINCDMNTNPDQPCLQCEKSPGVIVETGRGFVPVGMKSRLTRSAAIIELKRLLKPRTYWLRIWKNEGIRITAKWESDVSVSIYVDDEVITKRRTKRVMSLEQIQSALNRFKSEINCFCSVSDELADKAKRRRMTYFEELLYEAEK